MSRSATETGDAAEGLKSVAADLTHASSQLKADMDAVLGHRKGRLEFGGLPATPRIS